MVELVMLLGVMALLMSAVVLIGFVGDSAIRTSLAARLAAFDCDSRPGFCRGSSSEAQHQIRDAYLLGRFRDYVQRPEDIRLSIDLPRVDGAEKGLLSKLANAFRGFGMKAGPLIFSLPAPDQLTRSTVETALWRAGLELPNEIRIPAIQQSSRLALISDAWSADDLGQFVSRVRTGEQPAALLSTAASAAYFPAKDLLMPVMDALGLEPDTKPFRRAFHNVDTDVSYSNSRIRVR
jgi:hypothetical protein